MEWSSVAYLSPITAALKSLTSCHCFSWYLWDICVCTSERSVQRYRTGLQWVIKHAVVREKPQLPEWSSSQVFSDTTWPSMCMVTDDSRETSLPLHGLCAGGCVGQPRRGLTLVCVFALAPCQGKENTWSWSPVLSADIFGKGCWIQVCVWSYASPSQVKHRETQRLLHFSV